jgi:RNA polymerase sigma-70 factor, ECF subfamily
MVQTGQDSDEMLMSRIKRGDHAAFSVLVRRHTKMFFAAAYRMCGEAQASEDVVQEAFLKLWQRPDAWDPAKGTKFTTWFYRVVTNLAIDRQRREKKRYVNPDVMNVIPDRGPHADQQMQASEEEEILERAIDALPERQKAALNLCVYEGLSNKEAADVLGIGVKALESLLMRAKAGLKEEFKREGLIDNGDPEGKGEYMYERRRSHV